MSDKPSQSPSKLTIWKKIAPLFTDYFFRSNERLKAWFFLITITLCVIALAMVLAALSWWTAGFWVVLTAKALLPLIICMAKFAGLLAAFVTAHVLKNYFIGKLTICWRTWLTKHLINKLLAGKVNYLDLTRHEELDNIPQRIQEDVNSFVKQTLHQGFDLLRSALTLVTFVATLWVVGGALSFIALGFHIVIPGYLVWIAIAIAITATITTRYIAKSLAEKNKKAASAEADLRQRLEIVIDQSENIALEKAEGYHHNALLDQTQILQENDQQRLSIQTRLVAFQEFYIQLSGIIPYLLAAPLYFLGQIELAQLMQTAMAFGQVTYTLSWFVEAYQQLTEYEAIIERLSELQTSLNQTEDSNKHIKRIVEDQANIEIKDLAIGFPQSSQMKQLFEIPNIQFKSGENTLLKGKSGLGKSTLLKTIAGTWTYGEGTVVLPAGQSIYFLPQCPTIPHDTLRGVLAYPDPISTYSYPEYVAALKIIGNMTQFIPELDKKRHWSQRLSPGQKQRIAIGRAFLKKPQPDWLFLDEATASLDEESEAHLYQQICDRGISFVSVSHNKSVEKYHSRILFFKLAKDKTLFIEEHYPSEIPQSYGLEGMVPAH